MSIAGSGLQTPGSGCVRWPSVLAAALVSAGAALSYAQGGGSTAAPSASPSADPAAKVWSSCSEYVPKGASRSKVEVSLPDRGISGYAVFLDVTVTHGRGETVMPDGFHIQRGSDAMQALRDAGWAIPEPDAGTGPQIERGIERDGEGSVTSKLSLPFVPLPKEPGRHELLLPPIPVAVGRANGQVMLLCTEPRTITIDDPIANEVDPEVKLNPPPRPQREEWVLARQAAIALAAALVLAAILAWLMRRWMKRPKPTPPKPRVLPWIWAMQELTALRASGMLEREEYDALIDRVSELTRRYLGERYGFDGVESTSEEIRRTLKRVYPPLDNTDDVDVFLTETDLIKFAKVVPQRRDCEDALARAEAIVVKTTPPAMKRPGAARKKKKTKKSKRRKAA